MALNYQQPRDPGEAIRARWSRGLEGIFDAYQASKQSAQEQGRLAQQDALAAEARANAEKDRQGQAFLAYDGIDPRQVTPEIMAQAQGAAPGTPANPNVPSGAFGQGSPALPAPAEHPLAGPVRAFLEKKKSASALGVQEQQLGMRKTQSEITDNEAQAARALRESSAGFLSPKDRMKQEMDLKELQIPGYQLGTEVRPLQSEAKDLRTGTAAVIDFTNGIDRLKELIKKHGSTNIVGEGSGEISTLVANLKLSLKEVQKLGVLSATDTAFLDAQVFDPSSIKSWGTRTSTALTQLDTINKRARSALNESLKSRGYSPASGGGGSVKVQLPDGRKGMIPAANLDAALGRGARRL